jgi:hypothetical protein
MKRSLLIAILSLILTCHNYGQTDDSYEKTLKKMFEVSGTEKNYEVVIHQMIDLFRNQNTEVDSEVWNELEKEMLRSALLDLAEMLAPVYAKYISEDELKAVIAFYQSPAGKKIATYTPIITEESMKIGEQWGARVAEDVMKRLEESR